MKSKAGRTTAKGTVPARHTRHTTKTRDTAKAVRLASTQGNALAEAVVNRHREGL